MATNKTTNYDLPQWEKDDFIQMDDFNKAFSSIDEKLKANADAASQSVTAEQTARANADTALQQDLSALGKNLGVAGHNARIALGSYKGAGTYGANNPNSLTFDFYPVLIFIAPISESTASNPRIFIRGRDLASSQPEGGSAYTQKVTWNDLSISWYNSSATNALMQLNGGNTSYCYVAIGYDKIKEESVN